MFDGTSTPYSPTHFLHAFWETQKGTTMAGYSEKDAHEFYIALMNQVHMNCSGQNQYAGVGCGCIVHTVFSGVLQSTVVCHACGNVTVANDEFLDLRYLNS
jgi:ubiquitin carboxyl-terminal hydrolase 22/27/51